MTAIQANAPARPVIVIVGPSGSGKSSAVRTLFDWGLVRVHPTWTTRPRRADETNGSLEHRFVSATGFDRLEAAGFFCDTVAMFGLPYRYGLPPVAAQPDGPVDVVMLRASLVERFRAHVPQLIVYQIEDSMERAAARVVARDEPPIVTAARIAANERETIEGWRVADRLFVNSGSIESLALDLAHAAAGDLARAAELVTAR